MTPDTEAAKIAAGSLTTTPKELVERLTRPIIAIEHRTGQEAFDIMADRIRTALSRPQTVDREAIESAIRIGIWNACKGHGMGDQYIYPIIFNVLADPTLAALLHPIDDISETGGGV